ncbi:MAG: tetratricopeptide repeat protein [Terracidiphilus sp.]
MRRTVLAFCLAIAFTNSNVNAVARAEEPVQTLQSLLAEARDAQSRRDFNAAAESYRKAVELEPSVPELWANLGLMYHESGNPAEAIRSFKEAIRLNPSLFVPQLFLGIEYLGSRNPEAAIPFLEKAEKLNPKDVQAVLNLGKAYAMMDRADHSAEAYARAAQLAPNDGNIRLSLGTEYLQQVESDARLMTSTYRHSAYAALRAAESFSEEDNFVQAEKVYKAALASGLPAPCTHAEFGITLLRKKKVAEAREQFELETRSGSHCGLAVLGIAVAEVAEGNQDAALIKLTSLSMADPGFVQSSLPLFRDAISADQARQLIELAQSQRDAGALKPDFASLIEKAFLSDDTPVTTSSGEEGRPSGMGAPFATAQRYYTEGQYAKCDQALKPALHTLGSFQLQMLASCSFGTGDFRTASIAAQRLKTNTATRVQGLYWESKADQQLATAALIRAGEIDVDSPRMHVLLGDIFRQQRQWHDAETEYRKAVALDPKSHAARLSLAIVLFTELKNDEAFDIGRSLLAEDPNDPEANLLAGEILVLQNHYAEAEPYLSNCRNLNLEFVPRLHALLGRVYAATDRIPEAISEYKAGLSNDEDGSIHYQLGRLYQKAGDKNAAEEAFKDSKRLSRQWDERARIELGQSATGSGHP